MCKESDPQLSTVILPVFPFRGFFVRVNRSSCFENKLLSEMDGFIQMLPAPFRKVSTHIDFKGQKLAERIMHVRTVLVIELQVVLVAAGIIGFIVGYITQQLSHTVYIVLGASALTAVLILIPWPYLRRDPIKVNQSQW